MYSITALVLLFQPLLLIVICAVVHCQSVLVSIGEFPLCLAHHYSSARSLQNGNGQLAESNILPWKTTCSVPIISSRIREKGYFWKRERGKLHCQASSASLRMCVWRIAAEVVQKSPPPIAVDKTGGFFLQLRIKGGEPRDMRRPQGEAGLAGLAQTHQ